MSPIPKLPITIVLLALATASFTCTIDLSTSQDITPQNTLGPPPLDSPQVILQRLRVEFLGADGHKLVGSGCPGSDGRGSIVDYHFLVHGVDSDRQVETILVAGDSSTLTWQWPCTVSWALLPNDLGRGNWEVFIAPSEPSQIYTLIFFYEDNTFAMGMVDASVFE
jgi:hypothetical protein